MADDDHNLESAFAPEMHKAATCTVTPAASAVWRAGFGSTTTIQAGERVSCAYKRKGNGRQEAQNVVALTNHRTPWLQFQSAKPIHPGLTIPTFPSIACAGVQSARRRDAYTAVAVLTGAACQASSSDDYQ